MSTMSNDSIIKQRKKFYIYDLPYLERKKLCQILDADGKWEELGGRFMDVQPIELVGIGQAVYHRGSPTEELLNLFGRLNGTIDQVFVFLSHMNHQWAMSTISAYVSPKYHCLLNKSGVDFSSGEIASTKLCKGNVSPSAPFQSRSWSKSSEELIGATGFDSAFPKHNVNACNFNQTSSLSSFPPKKMSYSSYSSQSNGCNPQQARYKQSHAINNNTSKDLNESRPSYKPADYAGNMNETRQSHTRDPDMKPKLKLNIPVSSILNVPAEKLQVAKPEVPVNNSPGFENDMIRKIPYSELVQATNHFDKRCILGQGGFGIVYKAYWEGNDVAVKKLVPKNRNNPRCAGQVSLKQLQTEMHALFRYRIDNILPLYGVSTDGLELCLVYQYMVNGSLEDRLLRKGNSRALNWSQRRTIAWGTAKGLCFLHATPGKPLIHGDIKSANILLDKDMEPKIGDFGLARDGPPGNETHIKVSSVHGTQVYLPPEYLRNYQLSQKVDVYSYGIVLLEIATGLRAFNEKLPKNKLLYELINNSSDGGFCLRDMDAGTDNVEWFEEILRIGKQCATIEKNQRPFMREVIQRFHERQRKIDMQMRFMELSRKNSFAPTTLQPLELQELYDLLNTPDFTPSVPIGVQGPPSSLDPSLTLPSTFPSFHPSEIRGPPSQVSTGTGFRTVESSRAATNGSSSQKEGDFLPLLTKLGTIQGTVSSDLSGIPERDKVVITPKMKESNMQLFSDDGDGDSGEEINDDDNETSLDSEGVFQMTDVKCQG